MGNHDKFLACGLSARRRRGRQAAPQARRNGQEHEGGKDRRSAARVLQPAKSLSRGLRGGGRLLGAVREHGRLQPRVPGRPGLHVRFGTHVRLPVLDRQSDPVTRRRKRAVGHRSRSHNAADTGICYLPQPTSSI